MKRSLAGQKDIQLPINRVSAGSVGGWEEQSIRCARGRGSHQADQQYITSSTSILRAQCRRTDSYYTRLLRPWLYWNVQTLTFSQASMHAASPLGLVLWSPLGKYANIVFFSHDINYGRPWNLPTTHK